MKYAQSITVVDMDTLEEVELEIWKLDNGAMLGIDASFLDQVTNEIGDPYNPGEKITIPEL